MTFTIIKASGEQELFNLEKFKRSLRNAGASEHTVDQAVATIFAQHPKTTREIHELTTRFLQTSALPIADRYNLKRALMELGPDGYPFEKFIARLFDHEGYEAHPNVIMRGACVEHEIDVAIQRDSTTAIVECKFHNSLGLKSDVKIPLYVQARFEDIRDAWQKDSARNQKPLREVWLVTNTQFTTQAIQYAECKGIKLIGWGYEKNHLGKMIARHALYPITALTALSKKQKRDLMREGLVLCKDTPSNKKLLSQLKFSARLIDRVIAEAEQLCTV